MKSAKVEFSRSKIISILKVIKRSVVLYMAASGSRFAHLSDNLVLFSPLVLHSYWARYFMMIRDTHLESNNLVFFTQPN